YCQDNELSWVDWEEAGRQAGQLEFARALAAFRRDHPVFRRRRFFQGRAGPDGLADIAWLTPAGREVTSRFWASREARAMGVFLNGDAISEPGPRGEPIRDDSFLMLLSAAAEPVTFTLPAARYGESWAVVLDTAAAEVTSPDDDRPRVKAGEQLTVPGRAVVILQRTKPQGS
ncbi:MAG TPA: glycogen debranching enzyme, partial [Streptosporangiaceae bacterium]|nr:glycogen debranching enzyme [Streptosporangiaceae bacterium]